jgi:hypothetical protein
MPLPPEPSLFDVEYRSKTIATSAPVAVAAIASKSKLLLAFFRLEWWDAAFALNAVIGLIKYGKLAVLLPYPIARVQMG